MNFRQFFIFNSWWGKLLGCFFGYLAAGSVGALIGIFIGNIFDKGMSNHYRKSHWSNHTEYRESIQKVYLEATFKVMGHIAKADGRISEKEIYMAKQIMDEMNLNNAQKKLARQYFNQGKNLLFDVIGTLNNLEWNCKDNPDLLKLFITVQYRCAQIDGLNFRKIHALNTIFRRLGFAPLHEQGRFYEDFGNYNSTSQNYQTYKNSPSQLDQAYELLEINKTANQKEVKKAYRRLISKNHPDKLIAQNKPAHLIKLANDKTQKITKAYDLIRVSKGWSS